jgi:hypothetical protein
MAELKTKETTESVTEFINNIPNAQQKEDSKVILEMMQRITGDEPKMWGSAIVGFTDVHLVYDSGRELDWFKLGFSPRKGKMTLYVLGQEDQAGLLAKLGKHSTGKGCLYINKLADVDLGVLEQIIEKRYKA